MDEQSLRVGEGDYLMSLSKLTGKKIADVTFYISVEFGEPVIKVCDLVFEDGSEMGFEGEHDFPYLTTYARWEIPNTDDDTLQNLYEQSDDYKDSLEEATDDDTR